MHVSWNKLILTDYFINFLRIYVSFISTSLLIVFICFSSQMTHMMIVVVTAFALCWLPLNVLIVAGDQDERIWKYENIVYVWFTCHWLAMSHAAYNPVIYSWMSDRFREGFRRSFKRMLCYHRTTQTNTTLHRCKTYTAYTTKTKDNRLRNGCANADQTLKVPIQHICKYDGSYMDDDLVSDSAL